MARYIDVDKLLEVFNEELMYESLMHTEEHEEYLKKGLRIAINDVKRFPTADVVPKSEVERLQSQVNRLKKYDEERDIALHARLVANTKAEVAREIFAEIWKCMEHDYISSIDVFSGALGLRIAELKKKYTEDQT